MRFFQKRSVVDIGENKSGSKWHAPYASQRKYPLSDYNITMNDNIDDDDEQQQQQHESIEMEYSKNRQSLSELVQKLNCSASKQSNNNNNNNDDDDNDEILQQSFSVVGGGRRDTKCRSDSYLPNQSVSSRSQHQQHQQQQQQQHQQKWDPSSSQISIGGFGGSSSNNITRPVLITVKDGGSVDEPSSDAATSPLKDHTNTMPVLELTSRFIVDDLHQQQQQQQQQQKSSLSVNVSNKTDNNRNSSSSKPFRKVGMSARKRDSKNESSFVTPNKLEIARKERWRRGIEVEMEKRLTKEKGNTNKTRSTSRSRSTVAGEGGGATINGGDKDDNSSIYADSNTQGSQTTGNTTDFSSIGDSIWTDATDETGMGRCRRGHCSSNQHVAESVAEDFGTFAKLLLNDGYACFETAADITRETVGGMKIRSQRS